MAESVPHGGSWLLSAEQEELPVPLTVPVPTSEDTEVFSSPSSPSAAVDVDVLAEKDPSHIRAVLRQLHVRQNEIDRVQDIVDLRSIIRMALQANSDMEMMEVLQVGRDEMPEAIKTLQRALEREMEKESAGDGSSSGAARDTLDREFIESGIDALRRMSHGTEVGLPNWTITR